MRDLIIKNFNRGTIDTIEAQSIPDGAAHASLNWRTKGDKIELRAGERIIGTEDVNAGEVQGLHRAKKPNGDDLIYKVVGLKLYYFNDITWVEVGTDLIPADAGDISFGNYESLSGCQLFINSPKGPYLKIMTANPGSAMNMYDAAKNYYGRIRIKQNRTLLFTRDKDKTGRYDSYIDAAEYTGVDNEVLGASGVALYSGHLGYKVAVAARGTLTVAAGANKIVNGNTVTVGTKVYTYKTALTPAEGEVLIGANDTAALLNLKNAILHAGTPNTDYKCAAVHPTVTAISSDATTLVIEAKTKGIIGNLIASTETGADLSWNGTTLGATVAGSDGVATRNCFGLEITGTTAAGVETFTDNFDGTLTSDKGGTGTINYATGMYGLFFAATVSSGNVEAYYQWEDSNIHGITDFTFSATRLAGEGNFFRQDDGGGELKNIASFNSVEFCFHKNKTWRVAVGVDDTDATNIVWRETVGISNWRALAESGDGIYYIDDTNQDEPALRILTLSYSGDREIPQLLSKLKTLKDYYFDHASGIEWGNYVLFACRTKDSDFNNRVIVYDKALKAVDVFSYCVNIFEIYNGRLIAGDSNSNNIYELLIGNSDNDILIENEWESGESTLGFEGIKKSRRFMIEGEIGGSQTLEIYGNADNGGFVKVGEIEGIGSYVDIVSSEGMVGTSEIGSETIGDTGEPVDRYHYKRDMKFPFGKFNRMSYKVKAIGIGYVSVSAIGFMDIRLKRDRTISRYRK